MKKNIFFALAMVLSSINFSTSIAQVVDTYDTKEACEQEIKTLVGISQIAANYSCEKIKDRNMDKYQLRKYQLSSSRSSRSNW